MPLTETRVVTDEKGAEVTTSERKLYALAELKALHEEHSDEIDSSAYANALEKLAEIATEDPTWWSESALEDIRELFAACGITVPQKATKINPKGPDGKFLKDEQGKFIEKWITRDDDIYEEWDVDRGTFALNRHAVVDEQRFLRVLKHYLGGGEIRELPELRWGVPDGRGLVASTRYLRNFDLRSKDARIIREQGLVIHTVSHLYGASSTDEFENDYHYDGLSSRTMDDCNMLLTDLVGEALNMLRSEYEYRISEEALLEDAEANEYHFDRNGRVA